MAHTMKNYQTKALRRDAIQVLWDSKGAWLDVDAAVSAMPSSPFRHNVVDALCALARDGVVQTDVQGGETVFRMTAR